MKTDSRQSAFRLTIDDLGLFPEVETGILSLGEDAPVYCSWLTNYHPPSAKFRDSRPARNGLHFNLLEGPSATRAPVLVDRQGNFNRRWFDFIWPTPEMRKAVELELEVQLHAVRAWFPELSHIDSHLHLHSIPWIYRLLERAQERLGIAHLRNPSQPLRDDSFLIARPGQFAKVALLRFFSWRNRPLAPPCSGLSRLFAMNSEYCRAILPKGIRELVWHAAAKPATTLPTANYRFMSEAQLELRAHELAELRAFLAQSATANGI